MQAARGASLTPGSVGQTQRPRRRIALFVGTALAAYLLDLGSKLLAVRELSGHDVEVLGSFFKLTLVRNPGAAFSTGTAHTEVFSVLAIAATVAVIWVGRRVRTPLWALALGLLLAGIAGNLTDRLFRSPGALRGHVIDFFQLPHWPVFNVADICIDAAVALILVQAVRGVHVDGRREVRS